MTIEIVERTSRSSLYTRILTVGCLIGASIMFGYWQHSVYAGMFLAALTAAFIERTER